MASINGIQIKGLKKFRDHEGAPVFQGNVYYKGKKLGFWSQDSWGGPDIFDFDTRVLDAEVEKYKASDRVEPEYKEYTSLDILLGDLLTLMDREKTYKKAMKGGWKAYVEVSDGYHVNFYYTPEDNEKDIKASPYYKQFVKNAEKEFFKDAETQIVIYTIHDTNAFDIAV